MKDYLRRMEVEGVQRVKMFLVITTAYVLFWGPLFFVTLVNHPVVGTPLGHEVNAIMLIKTYSMEEVFGSSKFKQIFCKNVTIFLTTFITNTFFLLF